MQVNIIGLEDFSGDFITNEALDRLDIGGSLIGVIAVIVIIFV